MRLLRQNLQFFLAMTEKCTILNLEKRNVNSGKLEDIKKRAEELKTTKNSNSNFQQEISPFTIAIDLVSGTMIGVVSGIFADKFFNSKPWFLIIFTIIGILAGFNIVRQRLNNKK